jgi:ABC-type Mn2+/Zn2+ transport system ATPase subunit
VDLLRLEKAVIGYTRALLPPLELAVRPGQRLAVLGPNGGGKTTLLRSLLGLTPLLGGQRWVDPVSPVQIGYVPQAHAADRVFPLTAQEVVLQGRFHRIGVGRFPRAADRAFAARQLERVGLAEAAHQPYRSLSGGQRQRVLLARALCGEPGLLVLDEVTSDLDPAAAAALLDEVDQLATGGGVSVVFVTHEIAEAATHATEVALVDTRRGLFETGPADRYLTGEQMTRLYGRPVNIERREGGTLVYVEARARG